jgi:hypothetical protein
MRGKEELIGVLLLLGGLSAAGGIAWIVLVVRIMVRHVKGDRNSENELTNGEIAGLMVATIVITTGSFHATRFLVKIALDLCAY